MSKRKSKDMHLVPYCGMRNPPKNRRAGTLDECLKAGQVRYYGVQAQTTKINDYIKKQKMLANENAKKKRKKANEDTKKANNDVIKANKSVIKANNSEIEAQIAEQQVQNIQNAAKKLGRPKKNTTTTTAKKPGGRPRGRPKKNTTTTTAKNTTSKNTSAKKFPLLEKFVKEEEKKRAIKNI